MLDSRPPAPALPQLPQPTAHGRSAAKTHAPTDENALNQLRALSPLPSLVLEYRTLQVGGCIVWHRKGACLRFGHWHDAHVLQPPQALLPPCPPCQNFASKWVDADWVQAAAGGHASAQAYAAARPGAGGWPRVRCQWNQTATATGRLSSSAPNLQAGGGKKGTRAGMPPRPAKGTSLACPAC